MVERFWDFSVRTYGVSGVSQACLALQDERGVDVNMMLYCIWIGATRGVFNEQLYRAAMDYSHDWAAHVVRPLRAARTWMKSEGCRREGAPAESCMSVRKRIKAVELEAEKLQQDALESFALDQDGEPEKNNQVIAAVENIKRYFADIEVHLDNRVCQNSAIVVGAAIDGASPQRVVDALHGA